MKPEIRSKNLMTLLGWQGGTIHDACAVVGLDVCEFLYGEIEFDGNDKPTLDFRSGYDQSDDTALYMHENIGNLQYWLGAIAALNNAAEVNP